MRMLVCIDDTDNLESIGTGKLAYKIIGDIEERGWGRCDVISRHQLYVHDRFRILRITVQCVSGLTWMGRILSI